MKPMSRRTAGLLTAGGLAVALLAGPVAVAQAGERSERCPGGCAQFHPDQFTPDGFQVSSTPKDATTDGNYDPH
ncbi:hypothetical protein [Streptomyces flavofungini]|uniref:hypothetical protein n=1 Tax=Streptomyces flavofungini TaxID=68200 RepID=UPI0034DF7260